MPVKAYSKWRRHVELAYVEDWAYTFHPDAIIMTNCPIGPITIVTPMEALTKEEIRLLGVKRPRCDCVLIKPNEIWIVEAAVLPVRYSKSLGDLILYKRVAHLTPEFQEYLPREFKFKLLTPLKAPTLEDECRKQDIEHIVWTAPWTADYMKYLMTYMVIKPRW